MNVLHAIDSDDCHTRTRRKPYHTVGFVPRPPPPHEAQGMLQNRFSHQYMHHYLFYSSFTVLNDWLKTIQTSVLYSITE